MRCRFPVVLVIAVVAILALAGSAKATLFTWTGGHAGTPWYHVDNWDANGVPSQGTRLGTTSQTDFVLFDSETAVGGYMPTDTILPDADWSSSEHLQPTLQVLNGTINYGTGDWWQYGGSSLGLQIGDGDLGTMAQVNSAFTNWTRHLDKGHPNKITVNADGTLNQTANFQFSSQSTLDTQMTLNGGTFISSGTIRGMVGDNGDFVDFIAFGSSFTAPYGDGVTTDFADLVAVNTQIGSGLSFRSTAGLTPAAVDNGNGTFTVATAAPSNNIPEPATIAMWSLLGLCWAGVSVLRRRRKALGRIDAVPARRG